MPFEYSQTQGIMRRESGWEASGYLGHGEGVNCAAMQNVPNVGPIPQGRYTISKPYTDQHKGPVVMRLTPHPDNQMWGRAGMLIHGPHANDKQDSSEGCIILPRVAREFIGRVVSSGDDQLTVVEDFA